MGDGIIGKILYFWIFILGGLFIARLLGFATDDKSMIIFLVALAVAYIVFQVFRTLGKKKTAEKAAANKAPVRKGQSGRKKKR
ncbi:MAG: hypothetical protein Q4C46_03765 [Bacillota bacterium]|nr:hypothetical protein [Bacillota bacterium]